MTNIPEEAQKRITNLKETSQLTTGRVRAVSSSLYNNIENKNIDNILTNCEKLLNERTWALGVIAYDWAYRVRKQYNEETFPVFESWLKKYVSGWGDCDDFCTHALGDLISRNNQLFRYVIEWTAHPDFWVRRAAAVSLIYPIKKNRYEVINPFLISEALLKDDHYLVLKGYGWMLKVLSQREPDVVFAYLKEKKDSMPRVAFRYALEKLSTEMKEILMKRLI